MNRIKKKFEALKAEGRKGLVAYLTAGDPDYDTSLAAIRCALDGGVDVLELGVPFSDPTADGPTIQVAAQRALAGGMTVQRVLEMVKALRVDYDVPIVLFGYANPFFRQGYRDICVAAREAGADGMLIVDLPNEETGEIREHLEQNEMCLIPLIAPTTSAERARQVLAHAKGFVYYIMVKGVTGQRREVAEDVAAHVAMLRETTGLPIAVGFGIGSGEQARQAAVGADAVVVGSALVKAVEDGTLPELVKALRSAL